MKLLEVAKEQQGIKSNYELAKRLGISQELISRWKLGKSKPNGEHALILADMAKLSPAKALEALNGGFIKMSLLPVTASTALALPTLFKVLMECILC